MPWLIVAAAMIAGVPDAAPAGPDPDARRPVYRLRVEGDAAALDRVAARGFDIAGRDLRAGWVEVITDAGGLARLSSSGLEITVLEQRDRPRPLEAPAPPGARVVSPGYTDPVELESFLLQVRSDHPAITRLEVVGSSIQGRPILALLVSDNADVDEDEPSMLISGAQHSREVMTVEAVMDVIDQLTDNYGVDPAITASVDAYAIWCVPAANPDGLQIVFTEDDLWRKNARDNDGNGRLNWKDGVDTNRNYEWAWGNECLGSSGTKSAATYRGPAPATEPETRALIDLGRRTRPVFDIEYHSYGEDVFYAMGCDPQFSPTLDTIAGPDGSVSRVIGEQYAARLIQADDEVGFLPAPYGNRVDGIGRDHQAHEHGSIAFVTELNSAGEGGFHPDYATWRDGTVEGQRPGWLWLLDRIAGPAVGGHVVDAASGAPVGADVSLDEMHLNDGRRLTSDPATGRFHIIVVPGEYTLRVRSAGYVERVVPITVGDRWEPIVVALQPTGSTRLASTSFEDATEAAAWTVGAPGDDASSGLWEWGVPSGTHTGDVPAGTLERGAPAFDRTPGPGVRAFVTGNAPGASFDGDDVDRGTTTLASPVYDLDGWYAVEVAWQQWLRIDAEDPLDGLALEVSDDGGQGWIPVAAWFQSSVSEAGSPAWVERRLRLDDFVLPGPQVRLRLRATDTGPQNVVEAAIDDLQITGFSLTQQGRVNGVGFVGKDRASLGWQAVPGAADATYSVARGILADLGRDASGVTLGALSCLGAGAPGETTWTDPQTPPPGEGWFYVVRFGLGFSAGDWGVASDGSPRSGESLCSP